MGGKATLPAKIRLGAIGAGGWAVRIAEGMDASGRFEILSCFDVDRASAEAYASRFGCAVMDSPEGVVGDPAVEAVAIVTPNHFHRPYAELAASSGKHVFVEKPIANAVEEGRAIVRACRAAGVVLAVGHNYRRSRGHRRLASAVREGRIGTPVGVAAGYGSAGGFRLTPERWRSRREECPALPLMQLGIHVIDSLLATLGPIAAVAAFARRVALPLDNDDSVALALEFESGVTGTLASHYTVPHHYRVEVFGTEGRLVLDADDSLSRETPSGGEPLVAANVWAPGSHREEMEEFADCVRTGKRPETGGEEALAALSVVEAAILSAREGRTVRLPLPERRAN